MIAEVHHKFPAKIVIAPDSFKESLSAVAVCEAIRRGFARVFPETIYDLVPMADGGEGTVDAMVHATGGTYVAAQVRDPLGEPIEARYGLLGDRATAVIEMASASGLPLVPRQRRNPMITTTYGTGELIRSAMDYGARRIIVGIGGSATNDGGAGAVQALGASLLDGTGKPLGPGGGALADLRTIDLSTFDPRIRQTEILVACDVDNPLTGPRGASHVYGPQKGADEAMAKTLDRNLKHYAQIIREQLHIDIEMTPGAGAAGGLGASLLAFCGAKLESGSRLVAEAVGLESRLNGARLCITGEGQLDRSSRYGKVCHHVATLANQHNVPAIALVGSIGPGAENTIPPLAACFSIVNGPMDLSDALSRAESLIEQVSEQLARAFKAWER
jgi:glycerate kinase